MSVCSKIIANIGNILKTLARHPLKRDVAIQSFHKFNMTQAVIVHLYATGMMDLQRLKYLPTYEFNQSRFWQSFIPHEILWCANELRQITSDNDYWPKAKYRPYFTVDSSWNV